MSLNPHHHHHHHDHDHHCWSPGRSSRRLGRSTLQREPCLLNTGQVKFRRGNKIQNTTYESSLKCWFLRFWNWCQLTKEIYRLQCEGGYEPSLTHFFDLEQWRHGDSLMWWWWCLMVGQGDQHAFIPGPRTTMVSEFWGNFFCQERGADGGNVVAIAYLELTTWINMSALLSIGVENNILQKPWWPPQRRPPASFQGSGSLWDQARVGLPPMSSISGTAHLPNALHCIDCWSLVSNKHIDTPIGSESYSLWNGDCCTSQNSTDMKCCFFLISSYDFYQIFISDS